jgi:hypothetical protein
MHLGPVFGHPGSNNSPSTLQRALFHIDHIGLRGPILRGISSAWDTLIGRKSVGQAEPHRLDHKQPSGLVGGRLPDELATGKCWANSGIEANYVHSLGAPKTCKSGTKSMCKTRLKQAKNGASNPGNVHIHANP